MFIHASADPAARAGICKKAGRYCFGCLNAHDFWHCPGISLGLNNC